MEPLPRPVFDRELNQISLREIFRKDENGNYLFFDATESRDECQKKYRIPDHQRYNKWSVGAKFTVIDSIYKNFIIGSLSLSRHPNDEMGFYFNIEDGQSRLTVIQEYLDNKFKFKGCFFNERTQIEQDRFLDYTFPLDITIPALTRGDVNTTIQDHYYENFDRINRGASLHDNDKYWCKKNKPIVSEAIQLMETCKTDYPFMKTENFNTKDVNGKLRRDPLENFVTMISSLFNDTYKKSYGRHYELINIPVDREKKIKLYNFMEFYKSIYDGMLLNMPKRDKERFSFNNPGKFLSMVIMDYKDETRDNEGKKEMWIDILNIDRCSDNFMKGKNTLFNDFTDGDRKNQEQENIRKRLARVKEFYEDKETVSNNYRIDYQENVPE